MVAEARKVGDKRFRESYGRYFEDFEIGDVYEHRPGRTITETDNTWFTLLTMNQHPLHFDKEYNLIHLLRSQLEFLLKSMFMLISEILRCHPLGSISDQKKPPTTPPAPPIT